MRKRLVYFIIFVFVFIFTCFIALNNLEIKANEPTSEIKSDFFVDSSLFTHVDDETIYDQGEVDLSNFNLKLHNDFLEVYSNATTGAIRIKNKNTNYIWTSDVLNTENMNNAVKKRVTSSFDKL